MNHDVVATIEPMNEPKDLRILVTVTSLMLAVGNASSADSPARPGSEGGSPAPKYDPLALPKDSKPETLDLTLRVPLGQVVPCWTQGLQKMKVGGKAKLVCPPATAYGDRGVGPIPPNSTLTFEVELLKIGN